MRLADRFLSAARAVRAFGAAQGPVRVCFVASLLLSALAVSSATVLNRDGMLYVDTARAFLSDGLSGAQAIFNWPFLPILMALLSKASGLGLENAGHLLNALFLAGACSLMVDCARRSFPEAAWAACLTILALPGMNNYRNELLREYGSWFFVMLAFWLALRWAEQPRWVWLVASPAALLVAALFRPEAMVLLPALALHFFLAARAKSTLRRLLALVVISGFALVLFLLLVHSEENSLLTRIAGDLDRVSVERFDAKARALAAALIPYARDQAGSVLFWGSLSLIPTKATEQLGLFVLPLLYLAVSQPVLPAIRRWAPFSWAFLLQLVVLGIFALDMQFLAGRYVSVLQLFSVPVVSYALYVFLERFDRFRPLIVAVLVAVMLSNVLSFSAGKSHFIEAGRWLSANAEDSPRVCVESARAAYYAGWRFAARPTPADRTLLRESIERQACDLVVLEANRKTPDPTPWLADMKLEEIQRFGRGKEQVVIARPRKTP